MATFQVVISDPSTGQSWQKEVDGQDANRFVGREIGEEIDGGAVGLDDFTIEITGGSDEAGRPLRPDVKGPGLKDVLLTGGTGFKPSRDGERKRVSVRGREISDVVAQLNVSVVSGDGHVGVALGEVDPEDVDDADLADEAEEPEADVDEVEDEDEEAADAEEGAEAEEAEAEDTDEEGAEAEEDEEEAESEEAEAAESEADEDEAEEAEAEVADEDADEEDAEADAEAEDAGEAEDDEE